MAIKTIDLVDLLIRVEGWRVRRYVDLGQQKVSAKQLPAGKRCQYIYIYIISPLAAGQQTESVRAEQDLAPEGLVPR